MARWTSKSGDDTLTGSWFTDTLRGEKGDDALTAKVGNDTLIGGQGNDVLNGGLGSDAYIYHSGDGNDIIADQGGIHDTLTGGLGNDNLVGGVGDDAYVYRVGDGSDVITDNGIASDKDSLILQRISPDDVGVSREGNNLILGFADDNTLTVKGYFEQNAQSGQTIKTIHFDNQTVWDVETVKALAIQGTDGNDKLYGYETDDVIIGKAGNDNIYGNDGNDQLTGGRGDDFYL